MSASRGQGGASGRGGGGAGCGRRGARLGVLIALAGALWGCSEPCHLGTRCALCEEGQSLCWAPDGSAAYSCVDLTSDPERCGACDNACARGQICEEGQCRCSIATTVVCGDSCVGLENVRHCGGCHQACAPGEVCVDGACLCQPGLSLCEDGCWYLSVDPTHCGGCDEVCAPGEGCVEATCGVVLAMAMGARATCLLQTDGRLVCSVAEDNSQGPTLREVARDAEQLSVSDEGVCWLAQGVVTCAALEEATARTWTIALPAAGVVALRGGAGHHCALLDAGEVWCWGRSDVGQLGVIDAARAWDAPEALRVASLPPVSALAAGGDHACALAQGTGAVLCWGDNRQGQLGADPGALTQSAEALEVALPGGASAVAVGALHSCALVDGALWCWGRDAGRLGDETSSEALSPPAIAPPQPPWSSRVVGAFAGGASTCAALDDGALWCWGALMGAPPTGPRRAALPTPPVADVALGEGQRCALLNTRALWCWGSGEICLSRAPSPGPVACYPPAI